MNKNSDKSLIDTAYYQKIKSVIDDGLIGKAQLINNEYNIGYDIFAHEYVRGASNKLGLNTGLDSIINDSLALVSFLMSQKSVNVSSFGSLKYFKQDSAPATATKHCYDCSLKDKCVYNCFTIYNNRPQLLYNDYGDNITQKFIYEKLSDKSCSYSNCVFYCDNNVADNQIINVLFEDNTTATCSISAFSGVESNKTRIYGTKGMIECYLESNEYILTIFNKSKETIKVN